MVIAVSSALLSTHEAGVQLDSLATLCRWVFRLLFWAGSFEQQNYWKCLPAGMFMLVCAVRVWPHLAQK